MRKSSSSKCNRGMQDDLCSNGGTNGQDMTCCIDCRTSQCKQEEAEWAKYDTDCVLQGGTCQFNSMDCNGQDYEYRTEYGCGGPSERQCCAPPTKPTPPNTSEQTPPTVPPTYTPIAPDDGSGSDAGKTAGIVIGVLFGCVAVFGAFYYVSQNGNPLATTQQSFANLNNDTNTDGNVDGISNPLQNDGGADSAADTFDMTPPATDSLVVESSPIESAPVESVPVESVPVESVPVQSAADDFSSAFADPAPTSQSQTAITLDVPTDSLI